jgi:hypothetical protein
MPQWSDEKPPEAFVALTQKEMNAPNSREGHSRFLLFAQKKKTLPKPRTGVKPEILDDNGLYIVKADVPHLEMQD